MGLVLRNFRFAVPPFELPTITDVTSEDVTDFFALNVLDDMHPAVPHRTTGLSTNQDVTYDFGGSAPVNGVFVNRTNYPSLILQKSDDGSAWTTATPNALLWSRLIRRTPSAGLPEGAWVKSGSGNSVTVTPDYAKGPSPRTLAQKVVLDPGGTNIRCGQTVTPGDNVGRQVVATFWLRSEAGAVDLPIELIGGSTYQTTLSLLPSWQRYIVKATLGASATVKVNFWADAVTGGKTFLFGGAQLTFDTLVAPCADYETDGSGLVIPVHSWVGRRKCLLDLSTGFNHRFLRQRIPAQQSTDDGADFYSTGGITFTQRLKMMGGAMQFPYTPGFDQAALVREFPSLGKEINQIGERRATFELGGVYVSELQEDDMVELLSAGKGKPILFFPNVRKGGYAPEMVSPEEAFLVRRTSEVRMPYQMPEVFEHTLTFEEVI